MFLLRMRFIPVLTEHIPVSFPVFLGLLLDLWSVLYRFLTSGSGRLWEKIFSCRSVLSDYPCVEQVLTLLLLESRMLYFLYKIKLKLRTKQM